MLKKIGLKVMEGDEAFYYLHQDGELIGAVIGVIISLLISKCQVQECLMTFHKSIRQTR